jgi:hypothetical protein
MHSAFGLAVPKTWGYLLGQRQRSPPSAPLIDEGTAMRIGGPLDVLTTTPPASRSSTRSTVPQRSDPVISIELTEVTHGEWHLRVDGPLEVLDEAGNDATEVRVTISPNLVPGVPFTAKLVRAKPGTVPG